MKNDSDPLPDRRGGYFEMLDGSTLANAQKRLQKFIQKENLLKNIFGKVLLYDRFQASHQAR